VGYAHKLGGWPELSQVGWDRGELAKLGKGNAFRHSWGSVTITNWVD